MTGRPVITRRAFVASLGLAAAWRPAVAAPERPRDVGIGGTGLVPENGQGGSDRGIGGTGFTGTIQRFGSIVVNDSRISYRPDVPVTIDGLVRRARDLRIGHLVRVVAKLDAAGLVTEAIAVDSEVVGPVTAVYRDGFDVLGQPVRPAAGGSAPARRKGEHVAVSGLRRSDGAIVASLVEPRREAFQRVVGVVERDEDGLWIGGLKLLGLDEAWVGRRAAVTGAIEHGGFRSDGIAAAPAFPPDGRFSVESYLRAGDGRLQLGSGLSVRSDAFAYDLSPWRDVRAVLEGHVGVDGLPNIDAIRLARSDGESGGGGAAAGRSGFGRGGFGRSGIEGGPSGLGRDGLGGPAGGFGGGPGGGHGGGGPGGGPGGGGSGGAGGGPGR